MEYIAFPWEQAGICLRRLSLAGTAGNAAAWALFAALGGSPLICWGVLALRRKNSRADLLLPLLSLVLSAGLWFFVNPSYLEVYLFPAGLGDMGKWAFALTIDSVLLSWLLLRFLGSGIKTGRKSLLRSLEILLGIYAVLTVAGVLFQGCAELLEDWRAVGTYASETGREWLLDSSFGGISERSIGLSRLFLAAQTICRYLPEILESILCAAVIRFLVSCEQDSFHEKSLKQLQGLKKLCGYFLGAILVTNMCINLLQLLLAGYIYSSNYALIFPFRQIIVMLGLMLLSRFWLEGKKLQEDNKLFI